LRLILDEAFYDIRRQPSFAIPLVAAKAFVAL
jgi:hypothetical protein